MCFGSIVGYDYYGVAMVWPPLIMVSQLYTINVYCTGTMQGVLSTTAQHNTTRKVRASTKRLLQRCGDDYDDGVLNLQYKCSMHNDDLRLHLTFRVTLYGYHSTRQQQLGVHSVWVDFFVCNIGKICFVTQLPVACDTPCCTH